MCVILLTIWGGGGVRELEILPLSVAVRYISGVGVVVAYKSDTGVARMVGCITTHVTNITSLAWWLDRKLWF